MIMTRLTLLGAETNPPVVPNPTPKAIEGLMDKINDLLGNAMWIGIICGILGLIMAGAMIALHNQGLELVAKPPKRSDGPLPVSSSPYRRRSSSGSLSKGAM